MFPFMAGSGGMGIPCIKAGLIALSASARSGGYLLLIRGWGRSFLCFSDSFESRSEFMLCSIKSYTRSWYC